MSAMHESLTFDLPASHWVPQCVSRLHYHVTWTTRGNKPVLVGRRAETARAVLSLLAQERGVRLEAVAVLPDRVHLVASLRPTDCAASVVRELRGKSALRLLREQPDLRVALGGHLVWGETYGIATVSPGKLTARAARLARSEADAVARSAPLQPCSSC
jgi:putative transposase